MRLDLSAHEAALLRVQKSSRLTDFKRFAMAAVVIYAALFMATNAPAYIKIISASIQAADATRENALVAQELKSITVDPWTGKTVEQGPKEEALALLPVSEKEEGLLSLSLLPTSYEDRLSIPSLQVNAPIVNPKLGLDALKAQDWNVLEDQIHSSLLAGIVHYPGTAEPGKIGNAFFTGHSSNVLWEPSEYNTVFALLPQITVGADIYVTHDQKVFHYQVVSTKEVSPTDVSILKQGDQKMLTLMTCTPVGTALKRLVVSAQLIED